MIGLLQNNQYKDLKNSKHKTYPHPPAISATLRPLAERHILEKRRRNIPINTPDQNARIRTRNRGTENPEPSGIPNLGLR